jgi:hypothetical protein
MHDDEFSEDTSVMTTTTQRETPKIGIDTTQITMGHRLGVGGSGATVYSCNIDGMFFAFFFFLFFFFPLFYPRLGMCVQGAQDPECQAVRYRHLFGGDLYAGEFAAPQEFGALFVSSEIGTKNSNLYAAL